MMDKQFQQTLDDKLNEIIDLFCDETDIHLSDSQRTTVCYDIIAVVKAHFTQEKPYPGNSLIQSAIQVMTMKQGFYFEPEIVEALAARSQGELLIAMANELKRDSPPKPPNSPVTVVQ